MQIITKTLITWHTAHGRHDLPWQNTRDAYRIWLSEIMLQQTQVSTVIPYYQRFLKTFPSITELADAAQDEILHLWTGLGYYARARNLHKTAQIIRDEYQGEFPNTFEQVIALPGIGRSTAGAILAFSQNQPHAILDGNVKRVLTRVYAVEGWYGKKSVENTLWEYAEANTPHRQNVAQYTQAIMDLGAMVCTRAKPSCSHCPLTTVCVAYQTNRTRELPHSKPKTDKPTKHTAMLIVKNNYNEVLLRQNPPSGIWGGLWCLPQVDLTEYSVNDEINYSTYVLEVTDIKPKIKHTFSHFDLTISPISCGIKTTQGVSETNEIWYNLETPQAIGLPAPIKKILAQEI